MIDYPQLISTVGFPIVITLFLLMRMEKVIKQNTIAIQELTIKLHNGGTTR